MMPLTDDSRTARSPPNAIDKGTGFALQGEERGRIPTQPCLEIPIHRRYLRARRFPAHRPFQGSYSDRAEADAPLLPLAHEARRYPTAR